MILPVPAGYHLGHSLRVLRMGRYDPTIELSDADARAAFPTPDGPALLELHQEASGLHVACHGPGADWLVERERLDAFLGLEDDPSSFSARDTVVSRLERRFAGMYLPRVPVVFTRLMQVVLLQLVTTREAIAAWRNLASKLGVRVPNSTLLAPPTAEAILRTPDYELVSFGIRPKQARTLRTVARHANKIERAALEGPERLGKLLKALPGIGPWTEQYVLGSALGYADAVLLGDYNLPSTVAFVLAGEPRADDRRMVELLDPYRGHRFRVIRFIWMNGVHAPRRGPRV